jgi:hypothetical protein
MNKRNICIKVFSVQDGDLFLNSRLKWKKEPYYFITKEAAANTLEQWLDEQHATKDT